MSNNSHMLLDFWMGTAGSQIFLMQLGFLCYESGFVKSMWSPSVVLKNIEDTFVGIAIYILFSHSLITGESLSGIIGLPNHISLIGLDPTAHLEVFIGCIFATTCSSLISGAVLERMKNKAYMCWCGLILLFNYSFVAHWIWNPEGWLHKLGFIDGAGSIVVHSTGGTASAIAIWQLGPRCGSTKPDGTLLPTDLATQPNVHAIGAFILWYGWFAFNLSSPIANHILADEEITHSIALITLIGPACTAFCSMLLMYRGWVELRYTDILGTILAGLVSITACCFTVEVWAAAIIGFFASPIYFVGRYTLRYKLHFDDPLNVVPIHLMCSVYGTLMEGVFAHADPYGDTDYIGLLYGGYKHFGVQWLGTLTCLTFNVILGIMLWFFMKKCIFYSTSVRVSILDTYLGVSCSSLDSDTALGEMLRCSTNLAKIMIWEFHRYTKDRFNDEMLDFLCVINMYRERVSSESVDGTILKQDCELRMASYVLRIIDAFIALESENCVNVSGTVRSQILKTKIKLKLELSEMNKITEGSENDDDIDNDNNDNNDDNTDNIVIVERKQTEHNESIQEIDYSSSHSHSYFIKPNLSQYDRIKDMSSLLHSRLIDESFFDMAYNDVFYALLPVFNKFLLGNRLESKLKHQKKHKNTLKIPFELKEDWTLIWHQELQRENSSCVFKLNSVNSGASANSYEKR